MFKIDTKGFKKLFTEKGKTHMKHSEGHLLVLDHAKLTPKLREQLAMLPSAPKKMAAGGPVEKLDYEKFEPLDYEKYDPDPLVVEKIKKDDPKVKKMASGGNVEYPPCKNPNCKSFGKSHPNCQCHAGMAKGGMVDSFCSNSNDHHESCIYYAKGGEVDAKPDEFNDMVQTLTGTQNAGDRFAQDQAALPQTPSTPTVLPGSPSPEAVQPETPIANAPSQAPTLAPAPLASQDGAASYGDTVNKGYQQGVEGAKQQEIADKMIGADRAKALNNNINAVDKAKADYQQHVDGITNELKSFHDDLKTGKTDIDKYWDSHSKVASGIGLILAGFNPTNRPNAALEFLNQQIDRSVKNQVERRGQLFQALQAEFHNTHEAAEMTRLYLATDLTNKLEMASAKAADPAAKARALATVSALTMQYAPSILKVGAMTAPVPNDPNGFAAHNQALRFQGFDNIAKANEDKYVPGFGSADRPVSDDSRKSLTNKLQLDAAARDYLDYAKKHTGSIDPRVIGPGKEKAQLLQSLVREGQLGTVYKPGEQGLLDKVVGQDPTSFFNNLGNIPKIEELIKSNRRMASIEAKANALHQLPFEQEHPAAQIQPGTQYEKRVINGKAYMVPKKGN